MYLVFLWMFWHIMTFEKALYQSVTSTHVCTDLLLCIFYERESIAKNVCVFVNFRHRRTVALNKARIKSGARMSKKTTLKKVPSSCQWFTAFPWHALDFPINSINRENCFVVSNLFVRASEENMHGATWLSTRLWWSDFRSRFFRLDGNHSLRVQPNVLHDCYVATIKSNAGGHFIFFLSDFQIIASVSRCLA